MYAWARSGWGSRLLAVRPLVTVVRATSRNPRFPGISRAWRMTFRAAGYNAIASANTRGFCHALAQPEATPIAPPSQDSVAVDLARLFAEPKLNIHRIRETTKRGLSTHSMLTLLACCGDRDVHPKYLITADEIQRLGIDEARQTLSTQELLPFLKALIPLKYEQNPSIAAAILDVTLHHLQKNKDTSPFMWSNILYSMQNTNCASPHAAKLVHYLVEIIESSLLDPKLNPLAYSKSMYGLQFTSAEDELIRRLMRSLLALWPNRPRLNEQGFSMVLLGLKSMKNVYPEVQAALNVAHDHLIRVNSVSEKSLSMCFTGIQKMKSGEQHLDSLAMVLAGHVMASEGVFGARTVCTMLYGMRGFNTAHKPTRLLLHAIARKTNSLADTTTPLLFAQAIYGLQHADADFPPTLEIISALADNVSKNAAVVNNDALANKILQYIGFGMSHMHTKRPEVVKVWRVLQNMIAWDTLVATPSSVATVLFGFRHQLSEDVSLLLPKIVDATLREPSTWRPNQLGHAFYATRNWPCHDPLRLQLRAVLKDKLLVCVQDFNDVSVANILASFRPHQTLSAVDREILQFLLFQITSSTFKMSPKALVVSLYGLSRLSIDEPIVQQLLHGFVDHVRLRKTNAREMRYILRLLQSMGLQHDVLNELLAKCIDTLEMQHILISNADARHYLSLLQPFITPVGAPHVISLMDALMHTTRTQNLRYTSTKQLAAWCRGLFCLPDRDIRINQFLQLFPHHFLLSGEVTDLPDIMLGISKFEATDPAAHAMYQKLSAVIDDCSTNFTADHISNICYNLQYFRLGSTAAQNLMSSLAAKFRESTCVLNVNHMARAMFGLQHLNSGQLISEEITQAVSSKAQEQTPEFWREVVEVVEGGLREQNIPTDSFDEESDELEEYLLQQERHSLDT